MKTFTSGSTTKFLFSSLLHSKPIMTKVEYASLFSGAPFHLKATILIVLLGTAVHINSQAWNKLGSGLNGPVTTIYPYKTDVYAGGYFFDAGGDPDADYLARWDGCEWHAVAPGLNGIVNVIAVSGDTVFVAGNFTDVGGNVAIDGIAYWDGTQWNNLGPGLDYYVTEMIVLGDNLYVGGGFNATGDHQDLCIVAKWDGQEWHALGSGPSFCAYDFAYVSDMATDGTDLYVVGLFYDMGGIAEADRVARWDGTSWHSLGLGIDDGPLWYDDLHIEIDHQDIYLSGAFTNAGGNENADYLVKWDGNDWQGLSESLADSNTSQITVFDKNLYCSIYRPDLGMNIINKWNSQNETWEPFDSLSSIIPMIADSNNIYVGGYFEEINGESTAHIARWGEVIDCTSSLKNEIKNHPMEILIYPNPAHDILYFSSEEENKESYSLRVSDITGKVLIEMNSNERQINISTLASGLYTLQLRSSEGIGIVKFNKY